ncbi:MAG: SRPBCC family protein [Oscillatoriaceae bacterium SKW80]|nr:SRPBCC family protein [Oscillatoriaceae bacterium SKYG93]MCX8119840.1 SRPBCC family protein [Oscillatoriaceae bacterium SKW80]MDW8452054.1 SRPBCC family protein [Oscillatoriaceae cyanobacterium SKYGB_i_bin93]HIK27506.1 SRPBCC family protein [Oscillatoriaceae cyanobacterium M7585_C2015_266]
MLHFKHSSIINAPVEIVWNFHERADILKLLTPPWQKIEIICRQGGLEVGAISEFRIWLGLIPIKWVAVHTACQKNRLFIDEQREGPMARWIHRHEFTEENGKTRLTDAIAFSLPGGWLSEILLGWWVRSQLEEMFRYRHEVTKRHCEGCSSL